jgi:hypothetical protein
MTEFEPAPARFEGVLVTLSVSANTGGCTATLKNSGGEIFRCTALDPRMQNLLETAMAKAWYARVGFVAQGDLNVLTSVTIDITGAMINAEL